MFDINTTRTMLEAIERSHKPTTTLVDVFFPNVRTFVTETVEIEYRKGGRRMAPFIVPNTKGVNVSRVGSELRVYKAPLMRPKRVIAVDDVMARGFGEGVYSTKTPEERAVEMRARDLADLQDMIARRQEWMAAQLLINGSYKIEGVADDGVTQKIDNDGVYEDDKGTLQQYIPDDHVVVGIPGCGQRLFGAVTQMESDNQLHTYEGMYIPKITADAENDVSSLALSSRCVVCPRYTDDWAVVKVK